jgi:hypothetical protein
VTARQRRAPRGHTIAGRQQRGTGLASPTELKLIGIKRKIEVDNQEEYIR